MASWLERQASSHHVQLAATAVFSGIAIAGLIYGSQAVRRKAAVDDLKASIPDLDENHHADLVSLTIFLFMNRTRSHEPTANQLSEATRLRFPVSDSDIQQGRY